jgi:lysozyme family protein
MRKGIFDRRQVTTGLAAGLAAAGTLPLQMLLPGSSAPAGTSGPAAPRVWRDLADLTQRAQELGLSVPRMSFAAAAAEETYNETLPAVIELMDSVESSAVDAPHVSSAEVDALLERASELLRKVRQAERPREETEEGAMRAAPIAAPDFDKIAGGYRDLFSKCKISDDKRNEVAWYVSKITDPARRKSYEQVYEETCVPWYFVAITHGMEASFDTKSHLHNGDPLKNRTVQVPKGRPDPWGPPTDWVSSAVDAMKVDKFHEKPDWDLAKLLYRWEAYNGWRSRLLHNINTPYLWSFSNHYSRGKFVADGVWSDTAVSKQCGAGVMLKALVETGAIAPLA